MKADCAFPVAVPPSYFGGIQHQFPGLTFSSREAMAKEKQTQRHQRSYRREKKKHGRTLQSRNKSDTLFFLWLKRTKKKYINIKHSTERLIGISE